MIKNNGSLWTWGFNQYGQLGIGGTGGVGGSGPPTEYVSLGTGKTVGNTNTPRNESGIQAGHRHTCALLNDETVKALQLTAQCEGLFLDPVYTAKAMAGLFHLVKRHEISGNVLFWHTGGQPALFGYADALLD